MQRSLEYAQPADQASPQASARVSVKASAQPSLGEQVQVPAWAQSITATLTPSDLSTPTHRQSRIQKLQQERIPINYVNSVPPFDFSHGVENPSMDCLLGLRFVEFASFTLLLVFSKIKSKFKSLRDFEFYFGIYVKSQHLKGQGKLSLNTICFSTFLS